MGYTDTTHYKMKKPDATNKFNVADLNNAMDTMDTTMFKVDTDLKATLANNDAENKRLITANETLINTNDTENKRLISELDTKVTGVDSKADGISSRVDVLEAGPIATLSALTFWGKSTYMIPHKLEKFDKSIETWTHVPYSETVNFTDIAYITPSRIFLTFISMVYDSDRGGIVIQHSDLPNVDRFIFKQDWIKYKYSYAYKYTVEPMTQCFDSNIHGTAGTYEVSVGVKGATQETTLVFTIPDTFDGKYGQRRLIPNDIPVYNKEELIFYGEYPGGPGTGDPSWNLDLTYIDWSTLKKVA